MSVHTKNKNLRSNQVAELVFIESVKHMSLYEPKLRNHVGGLSCNPIVRLYYEVLATSGLPAQARPPDNSVII